MLKRKMQIEWQKVRVITMVRCQVVRVVQVFGVIDRMELPLTERRATCYRSTPAGRMRLRGEFDLSVPNWARLRDRLNQPGCWLHINPNPTRQRGQNAISVVLADASGYYRVANSQIQRAQARSPILKTSIALRAALLSCKIERTVTSAKFDSTETTLCSTCSGEIEFSSFAL